MCEGSTMIGWFFLGDEPFSHRRRSGGPFANMVVEGSRGLRGFGPSGWCDAPRTPYPMVRRATYLTRHACAYTMIGRPSVIRHTKGSVLLSAAPQARMHCGTRCQRQTYSKVPVSNHCVMVPIKMACISGSSNEGWLRWKIGRQESPLFAAQK